MAARTGSTMPPDPLDGGGTDLPQFSSPNSNRFPNKNDDDKKGKGSIIALVIVLILVGSAIAVLVFDIGGVRENHVMGFLRGAPLIGGLFPEPEADPLEEMTEEEIRTEFAIQQEQVRSLQNQVAALNEQISDLNEHNLHLARFEANWQMFRTAVADFSQMLVHNDPYNFLDVFYDLIDYDLIPFDILMQLYLEASAIVDYDADFQSLVSTMNNMEAGRAAEDLTRMMITNTDLAVSLLRGMGNTRRAEIFDEMEYTVSTTFMVLLSVAPPTFAPLIVPQHLPEFPPPIVPVAPIVPATPAVLEDEAPEETLDETELADTEAPEDETTDEED
ncbi:MAG: hypothetical protein FWF79_08970 [Defluviitaleaceae bacterium]|nr:hypothetical protein [Defluviitaleaceae bacterium]